MLGSGSTCRMAEQNLEGADAEHGRDGCDEDIGRHGEELPRLADTSQVDDGHQKDCGDAESFTMGRSAGTAEMSAAIPAATLTATVNT